MRAQIARVLIALVAAAALAAAPTAGADPTPQEQATAFTIARDYWATQQPATGGMPACGWPTITYATIPPHITDGVTYTPSAFAVPGGSCYIQIDPAAAVDLVTNCAITVHELGHLILGPNYFAADPGGPNHDDPSHSPDPASPMYWEGNPPIPACLALAPPPPPAVVPAPLCTSTSCICVNTASCPRPPIAHLAASTTRARAVAANRRALRAMRRSQHRAKRMREKVVI